MIALIDSYGGIIIRGMPGEKLGDGYKTKSRKSHARRQTGAIIARAGVSFKKKDKNRNYHRLKCHD